MFEVGNIITGYDTNGYSITTKGALMLVTETDGEDMDVVILACTEKRGNYVKSEFTVENDALRFEYTTVGSFMENYTPEYIMPLEDMNRLFKEYPNPNVGSAEIESEFGPYVLSDEMRQELVSEMKELLIKYHYDNVTEEGLNVILNEWCKNKGYLIRLFEKHPNYNGKFQIAFDYDYSRKIDPVAVREFANWFDRDEVCELYQEEIKVGDFTYGELYWQFDMYDQIEEAFGRHPKIETINGHPKEYYTTKRNEIREMIKDLYENNNDIRTVGTHAYSREKYKIKERVDRLSNIIYDLSYDGKLSQTVSDKVASIFDAYFPEAKVRRGQKLSKVVHRICTSLGVSDLKTYNKEFAAFADAINPIKVKRHTVISVHPVDYYTMSFGNSWRSCHDIGKIASDAGCYSSGCISYMLDSHSFIFYTVDGSYEGEQIEKAPKLQRQIFGYNDEVLAQLRLYPQSNDFGSEHIYDNIRAVVQEVIALCLEKPNRWVKSKKDVEDVCEHGYRATCFPDWYHYNPGGKHCSISTHKERANGKEHRKIVFGAQPICIDCGYRHSQDGSISCCNNYKGYTCRDCGAEIESEDDIIWINEQPYCEGCTTRCVCCDKYFRNDDMTYADGEWICDECLDKNFSLCDRCGTYYYTEDMTHTVDGYSYCVHCDTLCTRECAECGDIYSKANMNYDSETEAYYCQDCYEVLMSEREEQETA